MMWSWDNTFFFFFYLLSLWYEGNHLSVPWAFRGSIVLCLSADITYVLISLPTKWAKDSFYQLSRSCIENRRHAYLFWMMSSVGSDGALFSSFLQRSSGWSCVRQLWLKQKAEQLAAEPSASDGSRPPEPRVSCTAAPLILKVLHSDKNMWMLCVNEWCWNDQE